MGCDLWSSRWNFVWPLSDPRPQSDGGGSTWQMHSVLLPDAEGHRVHLDDEVWRIWGAECENRTQSVWSVGWIKQSVILHHSSSKWWYWLCAVYICINNTVLGDVFKLQHQYFADKDSNVSCFHATLISCIMCFNVTDLWSSMTGFTGCFGFHWYWWTDDHLSVIYNRSPSIATWNKNRKTFSVCRVVTWTAFFNPLLFFLSSHWPPLSLSALSHHLCYGVLHGGCIFYVWLWRLLPLIIEKH